MLKYNQVYCIHGKCLVLSLTHPFLPLTFTLSSCVFEQRETQRWPVPEANSERMRKVAHLGGKPAEHCVCVCVPVEHVCVYSCH